MVRHAYREVTIDVPDDWADRTVLAYSAPAQSGKGSQPSIVMTRDTLPEGMTVRTFAAKHLAASARGLPDFELEDSREMAIGGQRGVETRFRWTADRGPVVQRQVVVAVGNVVYTITQSCSPREMPTAKATFDAMIKSLQFGPPTARRT